MNYSLRCIVLVVLGLAAACNAKPPTTAANCDLEQEKTLRLRGELEEAQELLAAAIDAVNVEPDCRIDQHLEMARVLDRIGLHQNTRPVVEALEHIQLAAELLDTASENKRAAVELAFADYYYRAEMREREFARSDEYARRAIKMFAANGDEFGQADAVHRLGLIEFQRGNLDTAEALFIESLQLDIAGGERTFFRGEFERHIGYVAYRRGDVEGAVKHFERSLQARRDAGAIDASLFAAVTLANALIELDRRDEAKPHLDYAFEVAQRIHSPVGLERINNSMRKLAAETPEADQPD